MKRILFFDSSSDGQVGGSHHSLLLLVKHLNRSKYEKIVVLNSDNALRLEFEKHCEKVIVWNGLSSASFDGLGTKSAWASLFSFKPQLVSDFMNSLSKALAIFLNDIVLGIFVVVRYFALLRQERICVVHLNNWFDPYWIVASKLAGIPVIQHIRGIKGYCYFPICHWVKEVICISKNIQERLVQKGIEHGKTALIYNAIDTKEFRYSKTPEAVRAELGIDNSSPLIAIFGNIKRWKGQDLVIRACAKLKSKYPSIKCALFGEIAEGDYHVEIKELAQTGEMRDCVIFAGYRADVADCMNAADVIVHASIDPEPFGRVVIEAMTLGKPVVAANGGAVPEIIEDGISGLLFEPGNDVQLAERVDSLLSYPEEAIRLGQNAARRVCSHFDIDKQIPLIEEAYRDAW